MRSDMKVASGDSWVGRVGWEMRRDAGLESLGRTSLVLILCQRAQGARLLKSSGILSH